MRECRTACDSPNILDCSEINSERRSCVGEDGKIINVDLDRWLLKPFTSTGQMVCYDSHEYVKDMGALDFVCSDFKNGNVIVKNLKNR